MELRPKEQMVEELQTSNEELQSVNEELQSTNEELQAGRGYESLFVPALFAPWTRHLVAGAGIQEGAHVLDIACGSGVLARAASKHAGPSGRVIGLDPAPGMNLTTTAGLPGKASESRGAKKFAHFADPPVSENGMVHSIVLPDISTACAETVVARAIAPAANTVLIV